MYSTAAERGMAAPDPDAVRNQMVRNPKGDVDISGTFNKGLKALQNPELGKVVGQLKNFIDKAETDYINHPVATGTGNETPQMYTTPLTQKPNYLDNRPATGTGKENPKLDTRPATARPGANYDHMMQPMEATSAVPSPAASAAATLGNTNDGPDIMRNWDRFGKNLKPDQELVPLDSEEEELVRNHMQRWQDKMKNLPDPFAGPTIYRGADGSEFSAGNSGDAASDSGTTAKLADKNRPPEDWRKLLGYDPFDTSKTAAAGPSNAWSAGTSNGDYTKLAGPAAAADNVPARKPDGNRRLGANGLMAADDHAQYMKDLVAAEKQKKAAKQQANSVPASNAVSSTGKTEPVRMSMTMGPGGGAINNVSNPNIDQATIDRAREWAAKQNAPAAAPAKSATASKTTAAEPLWQTLARANGIANPNLIYPGQEIELPNGRSTIVDKGDTLSSIASKYRQGVYNDGTSDAVPAVNNSRTGPGVGSILNSPSEIARRARKPVKETDVGNTMDDGFKWGSATMPMQDGSTMQYHAPTNSYKQATPPTRPDLNTNISTITRDRTTDKNGQVNQNYSDVSIATNPATGTGDYMHRQDVNGTPTTTFRQNVPAAELAKLRSQHFNEDINRMQNLAGIRKK